MVATPQVILPVAVLEGEVIPDTLIEFLSSVPVVLLGYDEIPEQTHADQAREQFGEQASEELQSLEEAFEARDATVETKLVFTHEIAKAIQQAVEETDRGVVCHPNPVQAVEHVLVEVRRPELTPAIAATTAALVGPTNATITLLYAADENEADKTGQHVLSGLSTTLEEAGISAQRISRVVERTDDPEATMVDCAEAHDVVILGADEPSILNWIFGAMSEKITEQTLSPVLVVQQPFKGNSDR
ncbi:MAG: universal stress protein [Natronomonas sp.]